MPFKDCRSLMQTYTTKDHLTCPSGISTDHFAFRWVQFSCKDSRPLMQTYATKDNLTCPSGTSTDHFTVGFSSHSRTVDHSCKLMPLTTINMPFGHIDRPFCPPVGSILIQELSTNHANLCH